MLSQHLSLAPVESVTILEGSTPNYELYQFGKEGVHLNEMLKRTFCVNLQKTYYFSKKLLSTDMTFLSCLGTWLDCSEFKRGIYVRIHVSYSTTGKTKYEHLY